jgi:UDP-3-O-[3-hydroxymyristoyl] glucosamine N-acyltransferase
MNVGKEKKIINLMTASMVHVTNLTPGSDNPTYITEPGDYAGWPAVPAQQWRRQRAHLKKIGTLRSIPLFNDD